MVVPSRRVSFVPRLDEVRRPPARHWQRRAPSSLPPTLKVGITKNPTFAASSVTNNRY